MKDETCNSLYMICILSYIYLDMKGDSGVSYIWITDSEDNLFEGTNIRGINDEDFSIGVLASCSNTVWGYKFS